MRNLVGKTAFQYFAWVFASGFVLGTLRTLFLVPSVGERTAELVETPLMLAVVFLCARRLVRRADLGSGREWMAVGLLALALMLLSEFTVVLWLRGMSLAEYFAARDPLSGAVYLASLGTFAACPWLVFRFRAHRTADGDGPAA